MHLTLEWTVPGSKRHRGCQQGDGRGPDAVDVTEVVERPEGTVLLAPGDNAARQGRPHARETLQLSLRGAVNVHHRRWPRRRGRVRKSRHFQRKTGIRVGDVPLPRPSPTADTRSNRGARRPPTRRPISCGQGTGRLGRIDGRDLRGERAFAKCAGIGHTGKVPRRTRVVRES